MEDRELAFAGARLQRDEALPERTAHAPARLTVLAVIANDALAHVRSAVDDHVAELALLDERVAALRIEERAQAVNARVAEVEHEIRRAHRGRCDGDERLGDLRELREDRRVLRRIRVDGTSAAEVALRVFRVQRKEDVFEEALGRSAHGNFVSATRQRLRARTSRAP